MNYHLRRVSFITIYIADYHDVLLNLYAKWNRSGLLPFLKHSASHRRNDCAENSVKNVNDYLRTFILKYNTSCTESAVFLRRSLFVDTHRQNAEKNLDGCPES